MIVHPPSSPDSSPHRAALSQLNAVSGSSLGGFGYGCALPTLVALWREKWSAQPNTTDPLAPFGVVTLHPRAGWMAAYDYGGMRWSQTANYGRLPNPAMPHTFLAQAYDLADP
jgi:sialate O-acetylesterase